MEEIQIAITVDNSFRDIILANREWMLSGKTYNWSYQKSDDGLKVIIRRW